MPLLTNAQLYVTLLHSNNKGGVIMPVIRITDATWDRLKHWAVPLEDSPEDAVRKVLDAAEEHLKCPQSKLPKSTIDKVHRKGDRRGKLPMGLRTPREAYLRPILEAVLELGGSAHVAEVLKVVEQKMKPLLNDVDYQKLSSGGSIRWENTANWARYYLVQEGLLASDSESGRGVWRITEQGKKWLSEQSSILGK